MLYYRLLFWSSAVIAHGVEYSAVHQTIHFTQILSADWFWSKAEHHNHPHILRTPQTIFLVLVYVVVLVAPHWTGTLSPRYHHPLQTILLPTLLSPPKWLIEVDTQLDDLR